MSNDQNLLSSYYRSSRRDDPKQLDILSAAQYFKKIVDDYVWAIKETGVYLKEKPLKSSLVISTTGISGYFYVNNPSMESYTAHLATSTCDLAEVGDLIRNETKSSQLQNLIYLNTQGRLRRFTLGVCCFIWVSDYPNYIDLYEVHCKEVRMKWKDFPKHIVDIGVLGRWLWSEEYLEDIDINPSEWKSDNQ